MAGDLVVMCSGAIMPALRMLLPGFQERTGETVSAIQGASVGTSPNIIPTRLRNNEPADLVILFEDALTALSKEGLVQPGTQTRVALSIIGMAVQLGAARPDISSADGLRQALLDARSFAYSASASGAYVSSELLNRLGLSKEVARKGFRVEGEPVGKVVARGGAQLGFQQMSELLPVNGITVIGPLPDELQLVSVLSAAVPSTTTNPDRGKSLLDYILLEQNRSILLQAGLHAHADHRATSDRERSHAVPR